MTVKSFVLCCLDSTQLAGLSVSSLGKASASHAVRYGFESV